MRPFLMAGNWKMTKTRTEAITFLEQLNTLMSEPQAHPKHLPLVLVAPSFTALDACQTWLNLQASPLMVAAQTMADHTDGAYTGEISPKMLTDCEVEWVIIGHSERRSYYNETDETVQAKTKLALANQLRPIVCVGETLQQREAGETDGLVKHQVGMALAGLSASDVAPMVIAYEPVWAIGTGKVCDAAEANRVCGVIRDQVASMVGHEAAQAMQILYGGSMKPDNAPELLAQSDIDGGLVGGASLEAASFYTLIQQAAEAAAQPVSV
jgi:triosephosphate isomerase